MPSNATAVGRDGTVRVNGKAVGRVERQIDTTASIRVSWVAYDASGAYVTRQYARALAVAAVAPR